MDSARWETEALRESRSRHTERPLVSKRTPELPDDLVTLREAHESTGIPVNTLRKWARRNHVASTLDSSKQPALRMVSLSEVQARPATLGRTEPDPGSASPEPAEVATSTGGAEAPEGTMLVPIDAWNKMLIQLGNLHESGQQLAEARERAAKAETEATFLRERLAELRTAASASPAVGGRQPVSPVVEERGQEPVEPHTETTSLWRVVYRGWQHRRR